MFLTKFFASSHYFDLSIETRLLTGSSHYSNFQGTHRDAKSCRMFFPAENCTEYLFVRSYTRSVLYMLSVQRIPSETHPRQAAEFVFSFRMITMLCFAWSLNISHIFALSSRFLNFFSFFSTCFIQQDFLSKSIMFFLHDRLIYHAFCICQMLF